MLHHVSVGVSDVARAAAFYDAVLGALGYKRTAQYLPYAIAYGEGTSEFWIQLPGDQQAPSAGNGAHIGFAARSRDAVHRFHETSLANGGTDEGEPGPRPDYGPDYYGAFVRDPFGNKIEAALLVVPATKARSKLRAKPRAKPAAKRTAANKTKAKTKAKRVAKRAPAKATKRKAKRR
ncbi:MAG TPA: VOC family protein [Rhizomicrobium sp.]|jgi:catechol 2,3-dioxygenase-like lactoylglutathione lyase family enzyme|nr:VOC family protein [Rhizomicrobium sp.]